MSARAIYDERNSRPGKALCTLDFDGESFTTAEVAALVTTLECLGHNDLAWALADSHEALLSRFQANTNGYNSALRTVA